MQLTGPIGELLVDDAINGMDLTSKTVPVERAVELINDISMGIPDPELQDQFRNNAVKEIPKLGS